MHEVTHAHTHTHWLRLLQYLIVAQTAGCGTKVCFGVAATSQQHSSASGSERVCTEKRGKEEARGGGRICGQRNQQKERERQKHREYKSSVQTPNRGSKTAGMKEALKWEEQRKRKGGNDGLEKKQQSTCTIVGAENMRKREAHKFRSFQQSRHLA